MKYEEWLPVAELLGMIAVVASLVFVGLEIQQSREIARSEWTGVLSQEQIALDSLLSSQADIWRKGCVGENLTPSENIVFVRQFSAFYHVAFARWIRGNIGINGADPGWVSKEYAKNIHRYAGLGEMWDVWKRSRISIQFEKVESVSGFPEAIDSWLPVFAEEEPNSDFDVPMCGAWTP